MKNPLLPPKRGGPYHRWAHHTKWIRARYTTAYSLRRPEAKLEVPHPISSPAPMAPSSVRVGATRGGQQRQSKARDSSYGGKVPTTFYERGTGTQLPLTSCCAAADSWMADALQAAASFSTLPSLTLEAYANYTHQQVTLHVKMYTSGPSATNAVPSPTTTTRLKAFITALFHNV